jgi:hypothetical protein
MKKLTFLSTLGILALAASAHAAVLTSPEDFTYADTSAYTGSGDWGSSLTIGATPSISAAPGGTIVAGLSFDAANAAGFGDISSVGNAVSASGTASKALFSATNRVVANTNDTLWFSFLMKPTAASTGNTPVFRLQESAVSGSYDIAQFGFNSSNQFYANSNYWNAAQSGGTMALNSTYLVIGRITTSTTGNDQTDFVVYADGATIAESAGGITWTFTGNRDRADARGSAVFDLRTEAGGSNTGIDAIRFGNTFDSVVVPEPSTYALLGMGLAGVVAAVRRRKA